ncbi:GntR family transcriptional regulator, partial [Achromobacter ruhlandii]|nr:GntR family transcriptional regulator [Achromobacter ruhlandii]
GRARLGNLLRAHPCRTRENKRGLLESRRGGVAGLAQPADSAAA